MNTYYDYYKQVCVCPPKPVILGLGDGSCNEVDEWPVEVYSVSGEYLGQANSKQEFITIWNSDFANREVGTLFNFFGPFSFLLIVKPGQLVPNCLLAISLSGLYVMQYAIEYE